MKKEKLFLIVLFPLLGALQGVWAQTFVSTESELHTAVQKSQTITLVTNITTASQGGRLDINNGTNVTIDLNGHTLKRLMTAFDPGGQVIFVAAGGKLTIKDSGTGGKIIGGWALEGGGIYVQAGGELTITGGTISDNRAQKDDNGDFGDGGGIDNHGSLTISGGTISGNNAKEGGGIFNYGTLTISGGVINGNNAEDGGGISNGKTGTLIMTGGVINGNTATDGGGICNEGTAQITGVTISGNTASSDGGGIGVWGTANGSMVLTDVTITNNTAQTNGGGISLWKPESQNCTVELKGACTITGNSAMLFGGGIHHFGFESLQPGPTLKMQNAPVVQDNTPSDVHLGNYQLITLSDALTTGAYVGVFCTNPQQTVFTNGYKNHNGDTAPATYFFVSSPIASGNIVWNGDEAAIQTVGYKYVERGWDGTKVTETTKVCEEYTVINGDDTSGWYGLGDGWYVVTGNSHYKVLNVVGSNAHLILCNGTRLRVEGGVKLEEGHRLDIYSQPLSTNAPGKLYATNQYYGDAASIGSGTEGIAAGALVVHGGTIEAQGLLMGPAAIGGAAGTGFGKTAPSGLTVYGGSITATAMYSGAGIGSGANCNDFAGYVTIYGGTVTATGGGNGGGSNNSQSYSGAGIGGGDLSPGAIVHIYGGTVTATAGGADNSICAAGIGGGYGASGQQTYIHGGNVTAVSSFGAGIGSGANTVGGSGKDGGIIVIEGGTVEASSYLGAGIGAGQNGKAATITISGGNITARSSSENGHAIGGTNFEESARRLTLSDNIMVTAGTSATEAVPFEASLRAAACLSKRYAVIGPCDHSGAIYTVSGTTSEDTHTKHCNYCTTTFAAETHTFIDGKCTVCGAERSSYTVKVNVPANNGADDGVYETVIYHMVPGTTFKLPASPITFNDMVFAGWLEGLAPNNSYLTRSYEELLAEGEEYTINDDVIFTARYSKVYVTMYDNADNSETLSKYTGKIAIQALLRNRTLYKDGSWNTLCLPFAVSDFTGTPLEGATVKTLESASFDNSNGTLTLNFGDDLTAIEAGRPYIVKWTSTQGSDNLKDPVFKRVTINNTNANVETGVVTFNGIFSPYAIEGEDRTLLYLGAGNTLYYPNEAMTIGSCRAYFRLKGDLECGQPSTGINSFVLNFGDGETGISLTSTPSPLASDSWYSLDGRRLSGKPMEKGIYINNGHKVVIK